MQMARTITARCQHIAPIGILSSHHQNQNAKAETYIHHRNYSKHAYSYYDVLEITPKASTAQIKAAYYRLSKKYHPDVNTDPKAKLKFSSVSEAYETLGNKAKKNQYDRLSGHGGFSGFTGGTTDIDYEEFLKKQGSFKKKEDIPTGRSTIYNFDEFYRMHYGESIKVQQAKEEAKLRYAKEERDRITITRTSLICYLCLLSALSLIIWKKR